MFVFSDRKKFGNGVMSYFWGRKKVTLVESVFSEGTLMF